MELTNPFIELGKRRGRQEGLQKGLRQGRREGEAELVLRLLKRRLGVLPAAQARTVRGLKLTRLEALGEALLDLTSLADLKKWLRT